jgi:hypothetical protein
MNGDSDGGAKRQPDSLLEFLRRENTKLQAAVTRLEEDTLALRAALSDGATASDNRNPPKLAEFLLIAFATTRHAEAQIGDLNERFTSDCEALGHQRATRLYWARTLPEFVIR